MNQISPLLRKEITELGIRKFSLSAEEVKEHYHVQEVHRLNGNENPLGPSPRAIQKLRELAGEMHRYPDAKATAFRTEIARLYDIELDQVVHGSGSNELIRCICEVFINKDDECLMPFGTFKPYLDRNLILGGRNIISPLLNHKVDLDDMLKRVTPKTKLIVFVNPNNPIGNIIEHKEMEQFLQKVGRDIVVVFDEAYAEYVDHSGFPRSIEFIKSGYNIIVLRTMSKAYGLGGLRIGYAITNRAIFEYLNSVRLRFNVNAMAQAAAIEALRDSDHLKKCVQFVWDEKHYYYDELKKLGLSYIPTSTNFIFINVGIDDIKVKDAFMQKGILISAMTPSGFKGFIRVTIGTHDENVRVIKTLAENI